MKKNQTTEAIVADLLEGASLPPGTISEELADVIRVFLEKKAVGDVDAIHITLPWFYREKLQQRFNGPKWFGTIRKFVREELGRDPSTGMEL